MDRVKAVILVSIVLAVALSSYPVLADPGIDFTGQTPADNTVTDNRTFEVNISITNAATLDTLIYHWNGVDYSLYDDDLLLMLNFDNVSSLGENNTHVADLSKYENNGTVVGPNWTPNGKYGGAFNFSGNNTHRIDLGNDSSLNLAGKNYTISAWIYLEDWETTTNMILSRLTNTSTDGYEFRIVASIGSRRGQTGINHWVSGGNNPAYSNRSISLDQWYHIVAAFNTSQDIVYFYMDGAPNGNDSVPDMGDTGNWRTVVGLDARNLDAYPWEGYIDELRVWNRTLTPEEVTQQYFSNLKKYDSDKWELYVNQSKNSTDVLDDGIYNYFASATSNSSSNQTESRKITIRGYTVCVNETGVCWQTIQEAVDNATTGQTVVITDNGTYEENVTIGGKDLVLTSNGSSYPTVRYTNVSVITIPSAVSVNISRINIRVDGNTSGLWGVHNNYPGASLRLEDMTFWVNTTNQGTAFRGAFIGGTGSSVYVDRVNVTSVDAGRLIYVPGDLVLNNSRVVGTVVDAVFSSDDHIFENSFFNVTGDGIKNDNPDSNVTIRNSSVFATSDAVGLRTGVSIVDSVISSETATGLRIDTNSTVTGSNISGDWGINFNLGFGGTITIVDTIVSGTSLLARVTAADATAFENITIINSTILPDDIQYTGFAGTEDVDVFFINYLDVYVNDTVGSSVSGASVNVSNVSGGFVFNDTTNSSGLIDRRNITYAFHFENSTVSSTDWYTNHTINVSATDYPSKGEEVNMSISRFKVITLQHITPILGADLVDPSQNTTVNKNKFFTFTANVTCANASCGNVTASLAYWWDEGFENRIAITFNNSVSSEDLVDFPVLVRLNSSRISYSSTQNNGEDIRFVDSDGSTLLSHEIELWNESGDSFVWVKVPKIDADSENDFIWMYYNNVSVSDGQNVVDTWSNGYVGVWHLAENPNGTIPQLKDSTNNSYDGETHGSMTPSDLVNGKIDGAMDMDGSDDWIEIGDGAGSELDWGTSTDFTYSAWVQSTQNDFGAIFYKGGAASIDPGCQVSITVGDVFQFECADGSTRPISDTGGTIDTSGTVWQYISCRNDRDVGYSCYDGTTQIMSGTIDTTTNGFDGDNFQTLGSRTSGTRNWDGRLDEMRISNVYRSEGWINASYYSMLDSFNTYGSEETLGLVSTISGDVPFYTTSSNPLNHSDFSCLQNMQVGGVCQVNWTVNATGVTGGTYNFFVYADSNKVGVNSAESSRIALTIVSLGGNDCTGTNATVCIGQNCLEFHNSTGGRMAVFDENGSVDVTGTLTVGSVDTNAEFLISNSSNSAVASINSTGYMQIRGSITENQGTACSEPSEGWVLRDSTGSCVAYVDNSGNMWLKGQLCYNSNIV